MRAVRHARGYTCRQLQEIVQPRELTPSEQVARGKESRKRAPRRGGALIMASDLSPTPTSGLSAQICGDAHLANFGVYMSPQRRPVFDINDFDEALQAAVERGRVKAVTGL